MRRLSLVLCGLTLPALLPASPLSAQSGPSPRLAVYAGAYDVGDYEADTAEVGLECQLRPVWTGRLPGRVGLRPIVGLAGTTDRAAWVYAGLRADVEAGPAWRVSPSFAVSLFDDGDGKELGGPVEFRSGLEISYLVGAVSRLGVTFHHLSNADLYDDNPGSNSLLLTWTRPLGRR